MFKVEIVIRKRESNFAALAKLREEISQFVVSEANDKIMLNLDPTADWLKGGGINELLRTFGESAYVALAYFADNDELVMDFDGKVIESYEVTVGDRLVKKYVKKRMMIVNEGETTLCVSGYMLNHRFANPIVKILDVYSVKEESGVTLDTILER